MRGPAGASLSGGKKGAVSVQGDRHRRYRREGAGPQAALCTHRTDLALCRRCSPSGHRVRLHAHARACRSGKISGRICRISAGGRLLGIRCIFQTRTRPNRGRLLDAREKVCVQGAGIGSAAHGARVAPDRASVRSGGTRQSAFPIARTKARIAAAHLGSADGKTAPVSTAVAAAGAPEEPFGYGSALCAESVGGANALSPGWRVGDRQWRHRAREPRSPLAVATGCFSAAIRAAKRLRCCEASSRLATAAVLSPSPGSATCCPEFRRTPSRGLVNYCPTAGNRSLVQPRSELRLYHSIHATGMRFTSRLLYIDGQRFGSHHVISAVGVDRDGNKHVLGIQVGATENAAAVKQL